MDLNDRMLSLQKSNIMPIAVNFDALTRDDNVLGICLINNKTDFHISCKMIFNSSKLDPFKSKYDDNGDSIDVPVQTCVGI